MVGNCTSTPQVVKGFCSHTDMSELPPSLHPATGPRWHPTEGRWHDEAGDVQDLEPRA